MNIFYFRGRFVHLFGLKLKTLPFAPLSSWDWLEQQTKSTPEKPYRNCYRPRLTERCKAIPIPKISQMMSPPLYLPTKQSQILKPQITPLHNNPSNNPNNNRKIRLASRYDSGWFLDTSPGMLPEILHRVPRTLVLCSATPGTFSNNDTRTPIYIYDIY